jgi:hypothetical protein
MPRPTNIGRTTTLRLSTTPQVVALLQRLARTGLHGKNAAEVAEEMLRSQLRDTLRDEALSNTSRKKRR